MKLTAILLTAFCLNLAAKGHTQGISFFGRDVPLKTVFAAIEKQAGYVFFYDAELLNNSKPVTIAVKNATVEELLKQAFKNQPLDYSIKNKTVFIVKKEPGHSGLDQESFSQIPPPIDITGKVTDTDGNPLAGATLKVKGTNRGTTTNGDGVFILKDVNDNGTLEISYIGYETLTIPVNNRTSIVVGLKMQVSKEQDVTVSTGYWTTTKRLSTGNITKVTSEEIQRQPISNPLAVLEGRVPGLIITQNTGTPGGGFSVSLRGQNSIANGNNPFYIVDGVPFPSASLNSTISTVLLGGSPLNGINPSNIESIEVLKDADATAIYGSRGANGVILITTKKARREKTNVAVNFYSGIGHVDKKISLLNTTQYLQMRHEAFTNDNASPQSFDYDVNGIWDTSRYTNWQKVLIGNSTHILNMETSVSGGNNNTHFLFSGGYHDESTVYPGDFGDKKVSALINLNHKNLNQKLSLSLTINYLIDNLYLPQGDLASQILLPPDAPQLYDGNGNLNWQNGTWTNPLSLLRMTYKGLTKNLISNANIKYQILNNLVFTINGGYTDIQMNEISLTPIAAFNPSFVNFTGNSKFANKNNSTWIVEPQIGYQHDSRRGKFSLLAGVTYQQDIQDGQSVFASGYTNDALLQSLSAAATVSALSTTYYKYRYNGVYSRINYNYDEKYLINFVARRDGSSRFGPGKQFANFGAAGIGWLFTNEKFFRDSKMLSFGKVRASYGVTGNDQIPDYQYLNTWTPTPLPYQGNGGLSPSRLLNPDFAWEVNHKFEVGLDLNFLKDKISLNVDYFFNRSSNQLVGYSLPLLTGFSSIQFNLPALIQNTGMEFQVETLNLKSKDFRWSSNFNVTIPRNKLVGYPNIEASSYANTYVVGMPLYVRKLFHSTGVDPQTGVYTFEDFNKDGKITSPNDLQPLKQIGQNYFGGLDDNFQYKSWQLDIFVQFVKQTGRNYLFNIGTPPGFRLNQPTLVMDRWKSPGDVTEVQKFTQQSSSNSLSPYRGYNNSVSLGDNTISDASFIRLKNVALSYELPAKWKSRLHLNSGNIYLKAQNVITITNYLGMDPENQRILVVPPLRIIAFGCQLTF